MPKTTKNHRSNPFHVSDHFDIQCPPVSRSLGAVAVPSCVSNATPSRYTCAFLVSTSTNPSLFTPTNRHHKYGTISQQSLSLISQFASYQTHLQYARLNATFLLHPGNQTWWWKIPQGIPSQPCLTSEGIGLSFSIVPSQQDDFGAYHGIPHSQTHPHH